MTTRNLQTGWRPIEVKQYWNIYLRTRWRHVQIPFFKTFQESTEYSLNQHMYPIRKHSAGFLVHNSHHARDHHLRCEPVVVVHFGFHDHICQFTKQVQYQCGHVKWFHQEYDTNEITKFMSSSSFFTILSSFHGRGIQCSFSNRLRH